MKKLTKEEVNEIKEKFKIKIAYSDALNHDVLQLLKSLEMGETVLIEKNDWHTKTLPTVYIPATFRRQRSEKEFETRTLIDEMGWVVTRIK